jgi:hypothetical protein
VSDRFEAIAGEWRPVRNATGARARAYRLTIWGSAFSYGAGCAVASGYLQDRGGGSFAIEARGTRPDACRSVTAPPPFDRTLVTLERTGPEELRVTAAGGTWLFARVDPRATVASDDFLRGEWLLADEEGRPYRGKDLTRVSLDERGYRVQSSHCSFQTNSVIADREWEVRPGGSYELRTNDCRPRTLGDRLARAGASARLTAEPVESRIRVRIGARNALLVPAARFPELAPEAAVVPVNDWASRLAGAAKALPRQASANFALRATGLIGTLRDAAALPEAQRQSFAGLDTARYRAAQEAGLLPLDDQAPAGLAQHLAAAPIVVVAVFEGVQPVSRGDGLSLDYSYRVRASWRGGRRPGDGLIVRMPALTGKSRSPVITPEPGAEVLLLASRTGYVAQRLMSGEPPSSDRRVLSMTLPLMRVRAGRLVEAIEGANVLGAAAFAGTTLEQARGLAQDVERRIGRGEDPRNSRYFVTAVGGRELRDPVRLWMEYNADLKTQTRVMRGGVTAWFDGCKVVRRTEAGWAGSDGACTAADGVSAVEPAIEQAARWVDQNGLPDTILVSGPAPGPYQPLLIPLTGGDVTLRGKFE